MDSDTPIQRGDDDRFGYNILARQLAPNLILKPGQNSLVAGVELSFDGGLQGQQADFRPLLPLVFRWLPDMNLKMPPNHALQRTRPSRSGCNLGRSWAGSLSLGR
jgi:hypothetical protein